MPRITQKDSWVSEYRDLLKESFDPRHKWFVGEHRGSIRLEVKDNGKKQTRLLPYDWSKKGFSAAIPEIQQIYKRFYEGNRKLSAACEKVKVSSSNQEIDLTRVINKEFRAECTNASDTTWNKSYVPVLHKCQELLERSKGKPQNGRELMTLCLEEWEYGSRSRQIARRALQKFLEFAVLNGKLSNEYAPVKIAEKLKTKRVGFALTDNQILQLIASEKDPRWQFNYQLLAVYGLRPEELRFLVIKDGIRGKELWTTYEKSMGGTKGQKTEPRKLAPLFLKDGKGFIDWNLLERFDNGEELAPVGILGKGSDALRTRLIRNPLWIKFRKQADRQKEVLVPYAFRHRYAKVAHQRSVELNLNIKDIAFVMGHTTEVHQQNYARFIPTDTFSKFDKQLVA